MTRSQRLRALIDLNYPQPQREHYLVCTDCGSLSIVSKRTNAPACRPSHFRSRTTRRVRRPRKYVRRAYQRRQRQQPSALAELLVVVAVVLIAAAALHHLAAYS